MGKKQCAAVVCCSNGQPRSQAEKLKIFHEMLQEKGIELRWSDYIFADENGYSGTAQQRAESLMGFFGQEDISVIFDISGGNLANEILPYLDYEQIGKSEKQLWGYSDLTAVINAIYAKCGKSSVLYQVRNLLYEENTHKRNRFLHTLAGEDRELFHIRYKFLQGNEMSGVLVGGNVRCLLKLAGTPYWPDMKGKILLLESYSGNTAAVAAYFSQLEQMGVFEQVQGVLLGTFTELEQTPQMGQAKELLMEHIPQKLPVAYTWEIGHGRTSQALVIGEYMALCTNM